MNGTSVNFSATPQVGPFGLNMRADYKASGANEDLFLSYLLGSLTNGEEAALPFQLPSGLAASGEGTPTNGDRMKETPFTLGDLSDAQLQILMQLLALLGLVQGKESETFISTISTTPSVPGESIPSAALLGDGQILQILSGSGRKNLLSLLQPSLSTDSIPPLPDSVLNGGNENLIAKVENLLTLLLPSGDSSLLTKEKLTSLINALFTTNGNMVPQSLSYRNEGVKPDPFLSWLTDIVNAEQGRSAFNEKASAPAMSNQSILSDFQEGKEGSSSQKEGSEPMTTKAGFHQLLGGWLEKGNLQTAGKIPQVIHAGQMREELTRLILSHLQVNRFADGTSEAHLKLFPESLGTLDVKMTMRHGLLQATFVVDSLQGKDLLEQNLNQLRHQLALQGIQVEKMEILMPDKTPQQALAWQQNGEERRERREAWISWRRDGKTDENFSTLLEGVSSLPSV